MQESLAEFIERNAPRRAAAMQKKPQIIPVKRKEEEEQAFEKLKPEETFEGAKKLSNRTGNGFHQFYSVKGKTKEEPQTGNETKNFLAPVFEPPEFIKKTVEEAQKHSVKYYQYRNAVLTNERLRENTAKVVKNKNPQGLSRYIFITELIACKNGFLYYTVPLILNIFLLILNIAQYAFLVEIIKFLLIIF